MLLEQTKPFLTAYWHNLINITYAISPTLLTSYLPKGVTLATKDGKAFVSLVAFSFEETKVKGIKIPFHVNFPEINLRFYVNYKGKVAVCFINEFVPKQCIALVANKLYNEPYIAYPMKVSTEVNEKQQELTISHQITKRKQVHRLKAIVSTQSYTPESNTIAHYFKEHDLGLGIDKKGRTLYYRVEHPIWAIYPIKEYIVQMDFEQLYGKPWGILNTLEPLHILVAKGSKIAVYPPQIS